MHPVSGIARPLDLSSPTNRAIVLLSLAVFVVSTAIQILAGLGIIGALVKGFGAGLAVFFAWALGREVDPDHDLSALLAAGFMVVAFFVLPVPDLVTLLWSLLLLRVVNQTTGRAATVTDLVLLLLLTLWPLWHGFLMAGPLAAAAFLLDRAYLRSAPDRLLAAVLALAATVAAVLAGWSTGFSAPSPELVVIATLATVLFLSVIATMRMPWSTGDHGGVPLHPGRVRAAQALALATALLALLWNSWALIPLWAAIFAAGVWEVWETIEVRHQRR